MSYFLSPLEQFEVVSLLNLSSPIFNVNFSVTNLGLFTVLGTFLLVLLHVEGMNNFQLVQSRISLFIETIYSTILAMVRGQIGERNEIYLPFIYAIFTFLLLTNLMGNVSYTFTVITSAVVSVGISLTVWIGVTLLGLDRHRLHFFSYFVPAGCPLGMIPLLCLIELVSYLARAVSLSLRITANIVAGHALMLILAGFLYQGFSKSFLISIVTLLPFALFLAIVGLEIAVSFIQSFVFTILTCIYIKDSLDLH